MNDFSVHPFVTFERGTECGLRFAHSIAEFQEKIYADPFVFVPFHKNDDVFAAQLKAHSHHLSGVLQNGVAAASTELAGEFEYLSRVTVSIPK